MDEINKKHEDPMKRQQAVMELYRKTGANPLGGCLPMLFQLPFLIAMFRFFPASIELRQEQFLWADDLSSFDSIASLPFDIPFYGDHISLFTLLMAASLFFYTRLNQQMTPSAGDNAMAKQMKVIQYLMPFMMLFWFNSYASGLSYYYFLANVISFGQQFAIRRFFIDEDEIHRQIQEKKQQPTKKSKFQQRLDSMMKEQAKKK
jgi:YidC/Oxa1 family membrane protein insertase